MLAALSILANNSPPKRLFRGLVSLGKTKSVNTVKDSEGCFGCIFFFTKVITQHKKIPILTGFFI
jgi:hypothetical protein